MDGSAARIPEEQLVILFGDLTVVKTIAWIGVAVALLIAFVKLSPALSKFVATVNALSGLPAKLKLLDEIHHEVKPNTGIYLNDAVRRVAAEQRRQAQQLNGQDQKRHEQSEQLAGLQELMESGDADLSTRVISLEDTIGIRKNRT